MLLHGVVSRTAIGRSHVGRLAMMLAMPLLLPCCSFQQKQVAAATPAVALFIGMEMLSVDPPGHSVAAGWELSYGSEFTSGQGAIVEVRGFGEQDMGQVGIAFVTEADDSSNKVIRYAATIGGFRDAASKAGVIAFTGPGWHVGNADDWGVGWTYMLGWAAATERFEVMVVPSIYAWAGEDRADEFAVGIVGALRVLAGARF